MRKGLYFFVALSLVFGMSITGCGQKKAASSTQAIETANGMQTVEEKVNYLVGQAEVFYKSKEFQGVVDISQYVLQYLDKESPKAREMLAKAKDMLVSEAQSKLSDVKKSLPKLGN